VKFKGTLLRTVAEQIEGGDDDMAIDPEGVVISKGAALSWNFDTTRPPVGTVDRVWLEDGRLLVEGTIVDDEPVKAGDLTPAIGVKDQTFSRAALVCRHSTLFGVGLARANEDSGVPPITLLEDADALPDRT
jgi:hypothetical protein